MKSTKTGLPDPCETNLHKHLKLLADGRFKGQTPQGKRLVEYLMLNSIERVADRKVQLYFFDRQDDSPEDILQLRFGYPPDLPDLAKLKPPKGNTRPNGLKKTHYLRREQKLLPLYY